MIKLLNAIYEKLQDEESKTIFDIRLKYALTRNKNKMRQDVYSLKSYDFEDLMNFLSQKDESSIILFGAGETGEYTLQLLKDNGYEKKILGFGDNNPAKQGEVYQGLMVYSIEEIQEKYYDAVVIITASTMGLDIYAYLLRMGLKRENLYYPRYNRIMGMTGVQYFDLPDMRVEPDEIYIDGGCYDGETCVDFAKWCKYKYKKIIAFEPNELLHKKCINTFKRNNLKNIVFIPKGIYSEDRSFSFDNKGAGSKISNKGSYNINVTSIDYVLNGEKATFIKLDIEGCELEALKGAKETIKKYHPKLAICIYHKPQDIYEIPQYILELCPDYKFYIRHYSNVELETILYAL